MQSLMKKIFIKLTISHILNFGRFLEISQTFSDSIHFVQNYGMKNLINLKFTYMYNSRKVVHFLNIFEKYFNLN